MQDVVVSGRSQNGTDKGIMKEESTKRAQQQHRDSDQNPTARAFSQISRKWHCLGSPRNRILELAWLNICLQLFGHEAAADAAR